MRGGALMLAGVMLVLIGMLVIFAGMLLEGLSAREAGAGGVRGGGIVMLGPIPIIFGSDREAVYALMLLALVLMLVAYLLFGGG